jgi:hypothetical protein
MEKKLVERLADGVRMASWTAIVVVIFRNRTKSHVEMDLLVVD